MRDLVIQGLWELAAMQHNTSNLVMQGLSESRVPTVGDATWRLPVVVIFLCLFCLALCVVFVTLRCRRNRSGLRRHQARHGMCVGG